MDARGMIGSWELAMAAKRRSKVTVDGYLLAVRQLLDWCDQRGIRPDLADAGQVRGWLADGAAAGWAGTTMSVKLAGVRAFARFLMDEGELAASGAHKVAWPKIDEKVPAALTAADVAALIAACPAKTFTGVRDAAIIALLYDSMMRSDELLSLRAAGDVDLKQRTVRVRRGKGGKERYSTFSAGTAMRLDRYQRQRARQRGAALDAYWLANGRGALAYDSMYYMIRRRGEQAGLHAHPHMARAGGAIAWRRANGSTEGLMAIAGWTDLKMVSRYTRAAEIELALAEARRLHDAR